jgi:hypothetical protein
MELKPHTAGYTQDGKTFFFGPNRKAIILFSDGKETVAEQVTYKDIVEITNNKGYKIEHEVILEDGRRFQVFITVTEHNIELLEQHKEEELWES